MTELGTVTGVPSGVKYRVTKVLGDTAFVDLKMKFAL